MYVSMHVCACVCVCVRACACVYVCMYVWMCVACVRGVPELSEVSCVDVVRFVCVLETRREVQERGRL